MKAPQEARGSAGLSILGRFEGLVDIAFWVSDCSETEDREGRNLAGSHDEYLFRSWNAVRCQSKVEYPFSIAKTGFSCSNLESNS